MVFSTVEAYESIVESITEKEKLVDDLISIPTFSSINSIKDQTLPNIHLRTEEDYNPYEGFIGEILNEHEMVQLDQYIFKIDLYNDQTFVIREEDDLVEALIQEDYSNPKIMKFSTSEDVLYLLAEGFTGSPEYDDNSRMEIFCGGGCSSYNLGSPNIIWSMGHFYMRSRYVKAGIYFELSHHIYVTWYISPPLVTSPLANRYRKYRQNCKSSHSENTKNGFPMALQGVSGWGVSGLVANHKETVYAKTQGLRNILLTPSYQMDNIWYNGPVINCRY